jgi:prepilin-type N-terminal cleavage/methylation domain-containing protein
MRPPIRHFAVRAAGFSLIELVVAMVVIGALLAVAAPVFSTALQAYVESNDRLGTIGKARYATERIARELREVSFSGGAYAFTSMTPTSVRFTNVGGNTVTVTAAPPVATLGYTAPNVTATLTDEVQALGFSYYDRAGALMGVPNPATVGYVEVVLTLSKSGVTHTQRTRVALRNQ